MLTKNILDQSDIVAYVDRDGVYRYVPPGTLKRRLLLGGRLSAPEGLLASLSAVVERNGAGDNYSMIFVRVLEGNAAT